MILRVLTYNTEWGFLNLPDDIKYDAGGHILPHTDEAQQKHLKLIAKNIGLSNPSVCFIEEMGSIDAVNFIRDEISNLYGIQYNTQYSNNDQGFQGIGILIQTWINDYNVIELLDFGYHRAFGIRINKSFFNKIFQKINIVPQLPVSDLIIIGVHTKSLCGNYKRSLEIQEKQADVITNYFNKETSTPIILVGDFNNTPDSDPIKKIAAFENKNKEKLVDLLSSNYFCENITHTMSTQFSETKSSRIDYIWCNETFATFACKSVQIIEFQRLSKINPPITNERQENSDHLPVLGIFDLSNYFV